ncbi:hypothetical protein, partial [Citrobacter freundii]|uniref:hypothetical protein n=2 Tax=Pseudomonadota TaxID=1224 RepID=UPI0019535927
ISTIATTAAGVAMAQYLATGDKKYADVLVQAQAMMKGATEDFSKIGSAAADVLKQFPSG